MFRSHVLACPCLICRIWIWGPNWMWDVFQEAGLHSLKSRNKKIKIKRRRKNRKSKTNCTLSFNAYIFFSISGAVLSALVAFDGLFIDWLFSSLTFFINIFLFGKIHLMLFLNSVQYIYSSVVSDLFFNGCSDFKNLIDPFPNWSSLGVVSLLHFSLPRKISLYSISQSLKSEYTSSYLVQTRWNIDKKRETL